MPGHSPSVTVTQRNTPRSSKPSQPFSMLPAGHGQHREGQPWAGSPPKAHRWVGIPAAFTKSVLKTFTDDSSFGCEANLVLQIPPMCVDTTGLTEPELCGPE